MKFYHMAIIVVICLTLDTFSTSYSLNDTSTPYFHATMNKMYYNYTDIAHVFVSGSKSLPINLEITDSSSNTQKLSTVIQLTPNGTGTFSFNLTSFSYGVYVATIDQGSENVKINFGVGILPTENGGVIQISLQKYDYIPSEIIQIQGSTSPISVIQMELIDPLGINENSTQVTSNDSGNFRTAMGIPHNAINGTWRILTTSGLNHVSSSIQVISPNIFVNGQTYNTILESQFGNPSKTELIHDGAILILNQTMQKLLYMMGENITINTELTNIGNKTVTIAYCEPWVAFEIKNQVGTEVWPKSQLACIPEFSSKKTLQPGEHFSVQPWGSRSGNVISPPSLDNSGNYTVISVAVFTFDTSSGGLSSVEPIWSKPLQITVLPEKYVENETDSSIAKAPEFPFALPMLLVGIMSLILLYRIKFKTNI